MANIQPLLKRCFPLIPQHGFTRKTIALASTSGVPGTHANPTLNVAEQDQGKEQPRQPNEETPLSETAISALFGTGDEARRTLIKAWLLAGVNEIGVPWKGSVEDTSSKVPPTIADLLQKRLEWNRPVLNHLPEAFALLCSSPPPPTLSIAFARPTLPLPLPYPLPFPNPLPIIDHAYKVVDEALVLSTPTGKHSSDSWYASRIVLGSIYIAAELHQFTSPQTASSFLNDLLSTRESIERGFGEVGLFADYVFRSMKGIARSGGAV